MEIKRIVDLQLIDPLNNLVEAPTLEVLVTNGAATKGVLLRSSVSAQFLAESPKNFLSFFQAYDFFKCVYSWMDCLLLTFMDILHICSANFSNALKKRRDFFSREETKTGIIRKRSNHFPCFHFSPLNFSIFGYCLFIKSPTR